MAEQLLTLPQKPGTVIAIGDWWLVRLRPYEGAPSAWELLPFPSSELREHAERQGVKAQCVYGDEWVLAEVEQEGGYLVISDPREIPSGIRYFRQELAKADAVESESWVPVVGDRVRSRWRPALVGKVTGTRVTPGNPDDSTAWVSWEGIARSDEMHLRDLEPAPEGHDDPASEGTDLIRRATEAYISGGVLGLQTELNEAGLPPESIAMITRLVVGSQ